MWMRLFSASFEEMYSHSHNPNCYTSHPSGKTDSHIAGCRITLSQQDRNEHGQWQNICENTEYLCLTAFKFGSHSQHWPRFTDSSTGILFFRAAHSGCKFPVVLNVLLLGWDLRGHGGLVFEAQKEAKLSLIFLQHLDLNLTNIRSIKGQVRFILLSQIHTLASMSDQVIHSVVVLTMALMGPLDHLLNYEKPLCNAFVDMTGPLSYLHTLFASLWMIYRLQLVFSPQTSWVRYYYCYCLFLL